MKRKTLALFSSILLCSCAGKPIESGINFVEQRKAYSTIPEFSNDLARQLTDKCDKKLFQEKTTIYSPIGSELIRQYKENDEGFKELYSLMNVESEHFLLKDTFATAATEGNVDTGKFKDMVKTFQGTISELNTSIKDYFKIDFDTVIDSGLYHYSYFELKDCFTEEKETVQGKEFNHEGSHTYVSFYEQGSYYENEDYAIAEVKLSETTFRILQAKEGRTVDSDTIFQTPLKQGVIHVEIPEFDLSSDTKTLLQSSDFERQVNRFCFNKEGVYGTSFTYTGPTATEGETNKPDFEFSFNQSFTFASFVKGLPLFYGQVTEL